MKLLVPSNFGSVDPSCIYDTPVAKDLHPRTNLAHGTVQRQKKFPDAGKATYSLSPPNAPGSAILRLSDGCIKKIVGGEPVARMAEVHKDFSYIQYTMVGSDTVLSVFYHVPSAKRLLQEEPERKATVVIGTDCTAMEEWLGSLKQPPKLGDDMPAGTTILFSKAAKRNKDGRLSLNFHGRSDKVSNKNMQLVDEAGKIVWQMGKLGTGGFSVDYASPFTPLSSFGMAAAQFWLWGGNFRLT